MWSCVLSGQNRLSSGTAGLHRLVYRSYQVDSLTREAILDGIALPAMRRNSELDVTGTLWFDTSRFVQVLEGPTDVVTSLMASIERDSRHRDVEVIWEEDVAERMFARFGMRTITSAAPESIVELLAWTGGRRLFRRGVSLEVVVPRVLAELLHIPAVAGV